MTPERLEKLTTVLNHRQANLTVVLENVEDPRNITAVMRSCESVGIQDVYIITSRASRDKSYSFKSGRSAHKWLTIHHFDSVEACFAVLRQRFNTILTTHLADNSVDLYAVDFTGSIALVFGAENSGVSAEAVALADGNFVIPQVGFIQSLNISVACAVTIYEAYRQKKQAGHYNQVGLDAATSAALFEQWSL